MDVTASSVWRLAGEAFVPWMADLPNGIGQRMPGGWLALSGEPVADFNLAYVDDSPAAPDHLRAVAGVIQGRQLPAIVLLASAVSDRLAPTATQLGLHLVGALPLMVRPASAGLGHQDPDGRYHVELVTTPEALREVCVLASEAFELPLDSLVRVLDPHVLAAPDIDVFLARRDGQPVSTVLTTRTGDVVGIWNMGTPPRYQRQGAGRATLEAVMASHRERRARLFYLGATPAGKPLYDRVGFQTVEETPIWILGQSMPFPDL